MLCLGLNKSLSSPRLELTAQCMVQYTDDQSQVWYHSAIQAPIGHCKVLTRHWGSPTLGKLLMANVQTWVYKRCYQQLWMVLMLSTTRHTKRLVKTRPRFFCNLWWTVVLLHCKYRHLICCGPIGFLYQIVSSLNEPFANLTLRTGFYCHVPK